MRPKHRRPRSVGSVVPQVLAELGIEGAARVLRIAECWEQAVGADLARRGRPSALRGSVLEVTADSSVSCHHLQLRRSEILAALREVLGDEAPTGLRLRVGEIG